MKRKKICIVSTVPVVLNVFMHSHILKLSEYFDVTLVTSGTGDSVEKLLSAHVNFVRLDIERKISIGKDIRALISLSKHLRMTKYDCVFSLMPKSGLIGMLAGFIARTPVRLHIFTGQVWATKSGLFRVLLSTLDRLLALCSTHLLADSHSQKRFLEVHRVAPVGKIKVLGNGSISGVDTNRFSANTLFRCEIRERLGIKESDVVFLFLGRASRAKGVIDLARTFSKLSAQFEDVHLLLVGPDDDGVDEELSSILLGKERRYHRIGFTDIPEVWMAAADVFCLPSYREGFGTAVVEAASVGLPAIVSKIYGLTDAVDEGKTGVFHPSGDIDEIFNCMKKLYEDPLFRNRLAEQAHQRAVNFFSQDYVTTEMSFYLKSILK
ncbi:Glycosyltransferase involved in cell wall bisynthesis [Pseudomonas arsenicoxydans]|uniref:Glycosyltransferase involved in cell wall bisynthesis n=1 Tax=Pseudomonas arsenicoxydans TaxID=702115 RepID=A0A1H0RZL7_9PSED|nr:glycosyltransferase [Pseudomonas arsenicoxydans]SDP34807.1 Glycosyltransferase involved in cell wall bisynthesis [Pseudomonas arsenicoxydans]